MEYVSHEAGYKWSEVRSKTIWLEKAFGFWCLSLGFDLLGSIGTNWVCPLMMTFTAPGVVKYSCHDPVNSSYPYLTSSSCASFPSYSTASLDLGNLTSFIYLRDIKSESEGNILFLTAANISDGSGGITLDSSDQWADFYGYTKKWNRAKEFSIWNVVINCLPFFLIWGSLYTNLAKEQEKVTFTAIFYFEILTLVFRLISLTFQYFIVDFLVTIPDENYYWIYDTTIKWIQHPSNDDGELPVEYSNTPTFTYMYDVCQDSNYYGISCEFSDRKRLYKISKWFTIVCTALVIIRILCNFLRYMFENNFIQTESFECLRCQKKFSSFEKFEVHINTDHGIELNKNETIVANEEYL